MDETLANQIANKMSIFLNSAQMKALQNVLAETFKLTSSNAIHDDRNILDLFLQAKKVEGCSPQTIKYYQSVIQKNIRPNSEAISSNNNGRPQKLFRLLSRT